MTHIESRPSLSHPGEQYDFYVDCKCNRETLIQLVEDLKKFALAVTIKTMTPEGDDDGNVFCPVCKHTYYVDVCHCIILTFVFHMMCTCFSCTYIRM